MSAIYVTKRQTFYAENVSILNGYNHSSRESSLCSTLTRYFNDFFLNGLFLGRVEENQLFSEACRDFRIVDSLEMFSVGLLGRLLSLLCVARRSKQTHKNRPHNSKHILWYAGFIVFSGIFVESR